VVDDALEACLRASFRDENKIADTILRQDGPLGSFSSRIKTAYLLGIITASLYADLEIMRGIRNEFAHVRRSVRFKDQSIKDRCKSLVGAKAFQSGTGQPIRSPRQRFLISAIFAAEFLLSYAINTLGSPISRHPLAGRSRGTDVSCEKNFLLSGFSFSHSV
jgi:hypothetical protein